jgi:hypothetical protein
VAGVGPRRAAAFALAVALLVALDRPLLSQERPDSRPLRGAIVGAVTDTGLAPVANAEVEFVGTALRVTSDAAGRFIVTNLPPGTYVLVARRLAFQPTLSVAELEPGDTLRLALMLQPTVTTLTPVVVRERSSSVKLREFDERRRAGVGEFFTQAEIERQNPVSVTDLLRQSKTLKISPDGSNPVVAKSGRNLAYNCYIQVYVDGIPLTQPGRIGPNGTLPPVDLRNLPSPKELMGIEIYGGAATAPNWLPIGPQVAHSGCGVIMLWTRDGTDDQKPE